MKKVVYILFFVLAGQNLFGQAQIVNDPHRYAILSSLVGEKANTVASQILMQATLTEMELVQKIRNTADFVQLLNAVRQLYGMVETIVCQIDGLYLALDTYKGDLSADNCVFRMKNEIVFMKLDLTTDLLAIGGDFKNAFKGKFNAYDRMKMINEITQSIAETSLLIEELTTTINKQNIIYLTRNSSKLYAGKAGYGTNRYR